MYYAGTGGQPPPDAMASGHDKSYQRFQERGGSMDSAMGGGMVIDSEHGIAPRRLTDCNCLIVFGVYVLGMMVIIAVIGRRTLDDRAYTDVRRLTHGMDSQARLCGVDPGVEDKDLPTQAAEPKGLNLNNPSCVAQCPDEAVNGSMAPIPCLYPVHTEVCSSLPGQPCHLPGGQFGNVVTYHIQSQQSMVSTVPYSTRPFGGRYCMPRSERLEAQVLHGPLNMGVRMVNSMGSLGDAWGVMFVATLLAIGIGYAYVYLVKASAKTVFYAFLTVCYVIFLTSGLFFLYAVFSEVPWFKDVLPFATYEELNPLFTRNTEVGACVRSTVLGFVLVGISCGVLGVVSHLVFMWHTIHELIDVSADCIMSMKHMLIPPALEAVWKYLLFQILCSNFRLLMAVGSFDDHRIFINGEMYKGKSATFHFDWSVLPWLAYYIFGAVWIIELCNSFGQFLISFSVVSWYFTKGEGGKKSGAPMSSVHAICDALRDHLGSLFLGAAIIPWTRIVRVANFIFNESVPDENARCCVACQCCTGCFRCAGRCCDALKECVQGCLPRWCSAKGCVEKYSKGAWPDVVIRSQHFIPAAGYAQLVIRSHDPCYRKVSACQIVTVIGVVSSGCICASITYWIIMTIGPLNDPTSSHYIQDPLGVSALAFVLCANIMYGFTMLFDHTADTLLYCYAWNRKFNPKSIETFLPEGLAEVVDHDYYGDEEQFKYYGIAKPEMYLSTWMPKKSKDPRRVTREAMASSASAGTRSAPEASYVGPACSGVPQDHSGSYSATGYTSQGYNANASGASMGGYDGGYGAGAYASYSGYPDPMQRVVRTGA